MIIKHAIRPHASKERKCFFLHSINPLCLLVRQSSHNFHLRNENYKWPFCPHSVFRNSLISLGR